MPDLKFDPTDSDHNLMVAEFEIEHEDVFHLKKLYSLMHEWLDMNGFKSIDTGDDKIETLYWERVIPSGKVEQHIWWRVQKIPEKNQYYKYYMKIDFQTLNLGKKEVVHKGKKIGTNKGDVIIRCKSYLMLDYNHEWRDHPILKHFHKGHIKNTYKSKIDFLKGELWSQTYKLQSIIKQYMKLRNPSELPKAFHNPLGL